VIPHTPAARPLHPLVARLLVPFRERSRAEQVVGASVLLGHALANTTAETSLGPVPALLPAVTAACGCALGALGGRGRSTFDAR
jgi:hypothetical protein